MSQRNRNNPWKDVNLKDPEHMALFLCIQDVSFRLAEVCSWVKVYKWLLPFILTILLAIMAALLGG